ncbi:hypothetical protein F7O44_11325 [Phytoactinopolyspora sp. XMNu-373]|uniref:Sugar phosphate isomerase n=1 Tax=Phytoactinopolyspora mesophila TaxID=2650750 RepID=A0A7K3M2Y9_9ACTN|nr:hypothetical protein [Phytoactinopolyspora mesophila]
MSDELTSYLDGDARQRLDDLLREIGAEPSKTAIRFPAAARLIARGPADPEDPDGILEPRIEDVVRIALLTAAAEAWADRPEVLIREMSALYRFGDADEKRAVLRALTPLDPGPDLLPIVEDALRTNDSRLVAAALGSYGARHLGTDAWRQGVLKCLFVGVPLDTVAELHTRMDTDLARMVADYCLERIAAGREVPPDAWKVLDEFPDMIDGRFPAAAREA